MSLNLYCEDSNFVLYHGDVQDLPATIYPKVDAIVTSPPYLDARPEYASPTNWQVVFAKLRGACPRGPLALNVGRLWRNGSESLWWTELRAAAIDTDWQHQDTLIWCKPNANPIQGKVLTNAHEYVLLFGSEETQWNTDALRTPYAESSISRANRRYNLGTAVKGFGSAKDGRAINPSGARARSYVEIFVGRVKGNPHPAPMASDLAEHLVKLCSWEGQTVLDPFMGSGTTAIACRKLGRKSVGIEISEEYCALGSERMRQLALC